MKLLKGSERYIAQKCPLAVACPSFQIAAIFAAGTFLQSMMMEHSDTVLFAENRPHCVLCVSRPVLL